MSEEGARLATAHVLTELDAGEWAVIHGVAWPDPNIDHVVVGPSGLFVIDSKKWSGRITTVGGVLLRNGRDQTQTTRSAHAAASAVGSVLTSVSPEHVVPVLCFTDGDVPDLVLDGVQVCSIVTVVHQLTSRPTVFTEDEVQAMARELRRCLPAATEPKPARKRGLSRRGAVGAVGAIAVAVVLFAISNGMAEQPSDKTPPPGDQHLQPKDTQDKKQKAPATENKQAQR